MALIKDVNSVALTLVVLESYYPRANISKIIARRVALIKDVNSVASTLVVLKSYYPRANISKIIARSPKILLLTAKQVEEEALEVGLYSPGTDVPLRRMSQDGVVCSCRKCPSA